jgi:Rrf2 family iron-sulfur cluster assembly transcriptional regulator
MVFSRSTEYAIRAMTYMAMQQPGQLVGARKIAQAEHIPIPFLWKILHLLTKRRLIRSFKGIHGGYQLASSADDIPLSTIVNATDGTEIREGCILGLPECDNRNPCPLHEQWKGIRTEMTRILDETSLADLAKVAKVRRTARKR